jgi:hypothetical protein
MPFNWATARLRRRPLEMPAWPPIPASGQALKVAATGVLKAWRVLGHYVEGAFEGQAGAAEGAFFEETAD